LFGRVWCPLSESVRIQKKVPHLLCELALLNVMTFPARQNSVVVLSPTSDDVKLSCDFNSSDLKYSLMSA